MCIINVYVMTFSNTKHILGTLCFNIRCLKLRACALFPQNTCFLTFEDVPWQGAGKHGGLPVLYNAT